MSTAHPDLPTRAAAMGTGVMSGAAQSPLAAMNRVQFERCLPSGCEALVVMDDKLLEQMSGGQSATFIIFQTPEEGIGVPVSLNGFKPGFDALP